jgi:hypothetical protein
MFDHVDEGVPRSYGYQEIEIGKPLVSRYLRIFVKWGDKNKDDQDLMISTHVKTTEQKRGAAESVNYYNPNAEFRNGEFELVDFGAMCYGHELCYYTKSYLGESLRFTTRIMELDSLDKNAVRAIKAGIGTVAGLPSFASFLPYAAMATAGATVAEKLVKLFDKDDVILPAHDLDLHFRKANSRLLQSGRIVCVADPQNGTIADDDIVGDYKLSADNRLVHAITDVEYTNSVYIVLQINQEKNTLYNDFDYFQDAAELLARTNRGGDAREFVDTFVDMARAYTDVDAIRQIEEMALDVGDEDVRARLAALAKHMSPDMKRLYEDRLREILT